MDVLILQDGNDAVLSLDGLLDSASGEYVHDASVRVTLRDQAGAEVPGQNWPVTMEYVTDTAGIYRCTLPAVLDVAPGDRLVASITADGGPGRYARWDVDVVCRRRRR